MRHKEKENKKKKKKTITQDNIYVTQQFSYIHKAAMILLLSN